MSRGKIAHINAMEVLDSRGFPTIQVTITTTEGIHATALVPSGASKGSHEALELRDGEPRFFGKGVRKAVHIVKDSLAPLLVGESAFNQVKLDQKMIEADGTENKSRFGANAILGVSLALAKVAARTLDIPLYRYIGGCQKILLPCPMMNIINGGVHADSGLAFQEFMIRPHGAPTFSEAIRMGCEIFHTLKGILKEKGLSTSVGDEGGFAPKISSTEEVLTLIVQAIEKARYRPGQEVSIALDCAATEFFKDGAYNSKTSEEHIDFLAALVSKYPIDSIEDGMAENDWEGWKKLTRRLGNTIQLVGDDLFVTNTHFLQKGINEKIANSILIKVNQIGTLTETLNCIRLAQKNGYRTIISHRSGETEDTTIADIACATSAGQIKTGSLSRSERTAKYNRLLEIEAECGAAATYEAT